MQMQNFCLLLLSLHHIFFPLAGGHHRGTSIEKTQPYAGETITIMNNATVTAQLQLKFNFFNNYFLPREIARSSRFVSSNVKYLHMPSAIWTARTSSY
jgi:hypothetical protein